MRFTRLYTAQDNKSYFEEIDAGVESQQILGNYSKKYPVKTMQFRSFQKGAFFDYHTAPQTQYIVYLEGEVKVTTSGGQEKIFKPGDVLLAADLTGEGHQTETLTNGKSIIIAGTECLF